MKTLKISMLTILCALSLPAWAQPQMWADEDLKVVSVLPTNTLKVQLLEYDAGDNMYGAISYEWNYSFAQAKLDLEAAKVAYPGYEVRRVSIEDMPRGLKAEVPAINAIKSAELRRSTEGFYSTGEIMLNRRDYARLKQDMQKGGSPLRLTGSVTTSYFTGKVLERATITQKHCDSVVGSSGTLGAVIENLAAYAAALERSGAPKLTQTKAAVVKQLQRSCFDLSSAQTVTSFGDLLAVKVNSKTLPSPVEVRTVEESKVSAEVPVSWSLQVGP